MSPKPWGRVCFGYILWKTYRRFVTPLSVIIDEDRTTLPRHIHANRSGRWPHGPTIINLHGILHLCMKEGPRWTYRSRNRQTVDCVWPAGQSLGGVKSRACGHRSAFEFGIFFGGVFRVRALIFDHDRKRTWRPATNDRWLCDWTCAAMATRTQVFGACPPRATLMMHARRGRRPPGGPNMFETPCGASTCKDGRRSAGFKDGDAYGRWVRCKGTHV